MHAQPCNRELSLAQRYTRRLQSAVVEAVYLATAIDTKRGDAPTRTAHACPADLPDQAEPGEGMRRIGDRIIPKVATCPACIDNVGKDSPSLNRDPTQ
eukprot:5188419-Pyramimonas_sp.AAC.1